MSTAAFPIFTVSSLTEAIRRVLTADFAVLRVEGEIGGLTFHQSGHWYLTLKDEHATLNAVFYRGANRRMEWRPAVGDRVLATGALDVYAPRGSYNLTIQQLTRAGAGNLQARFEALKARLQAEGLFAEERKRPLPPLPRAVGIVTSLDGAALRDILKVHGERMPGLPLWIAGCRVQGAGAAADIARAIGRLERHGGVDVILVARGGGSAEDLWAFNEEAVVRAIARCGLPVVTGVGHESDVTLADLAADLRAATPTHAAQRVFPDRAELLRGVERSAAALERGMRACLAARRFTVRGLGARLKDPRSRIGEVRMRCDELQDRLTHGVASLIVARRQRLAALEAPLRALSPYGTLERGYAIVRKGGRVVHRADALVEGDTLHVLFAVGETHARVLGGQNPNEDQVSSEGGSSGTVDSR
jgi:exodeoxyribonuclease VII large subunit